MHVSHHPYRLSFIKKIIIKHLKNGDRIHLWCFEHPSASLPVYGIGLDSEESQWWRNTILPSIGCSKSLPFIDYYRLGLVMIFPYVPQALQESQALWESLASLVGCLLFSNPCWSQQHPSGSYCANRRVHSAAVLSCEVRSLRYCCAMLPTSGSSAISPQPPSLSKYQTIMHYPGCSDVYANVPCLSKRTERELLSTTKMPVHHSPLS